MTRDIPYYSENDDENVVRVFIIRHGQTDHNLKKILQGHKDTSLNITGIEQARKLGKYLKNDRQIKFERVISSDLQRCRQTAESFLSEMDCDLTEEDVGYFSGLRERFMGPIEGMMITEAERYAQKHHKFSFREFGEEADSFMERLTSTVQTNVQNAGNDGIKNMALVSHGGSIRAIIKWLGYDANNAQRIIVYNTSVTIVDFIKDKKEFMVRRVGNTQHLGDGEFLVSDLRLR
ncbi:hypothetical protein RNJ44_03569 [Nakaseomyces bracarensis]|uniref:Phosphoglycerate mutase n=1 Tax=Nakaseomyces bracarensis TaxID=273131 RepID=A0ABR4NXI2_9SACH